MAYLATFASPNFDVLMQPVALNVYEDFLQ